MENIQPFDWYRIFLGNENDELFMLEILFRVVFIYLFTVGVYRILGKRGNKSISMYENVLIIALGSACGDGMFYPEVPLLYACIVVVAVVLMTRLFQFLQIKSKRFNDFVDGEPLLLVHDGNIIKNNLIRARLREEELNTLLRNAGIRDISKLQYAIFETTGELSVFCSDSENAKYTPVIPTIPKTLVN